jgi:Ca2+-binding RTX toxin-like protein
MAVAASLAFAGAARAAVVSTDDGSGGAGNTRLVVVGAGSDNDVISITASFGIDTIHYKVTDTAGVSESDSDCSPSAANEITCDMRGLSSIRVDAGAGTDGVTIGTGNGMGTVPATLIGGTGNDQLTGGNGADTLEGDGGADDMSGSGGIDTVTYVDRPLDDPDAGTHTGVAVDIGVGGANDGSVVDGPLGAMDNVHADVENVTGGGGIDHLTGNAGANILSGGSGEDTLIGGLGADTFIGGVGDVVSYADRTSPTDAVTVTIGDGANDGAPGEGDNVNSGIAGLVGGAGDDHLTGDAQPNLILGGDGNDVIAGGGGNDSYPSFACAFGRLEGQAGDDQITGGEGVDALDGGEGDDVLDGAGGNDQSEPSVACHPLGYVSGGPGDDIVDGGAGTDAESGGSGADEMHALDGSIDHVDCGADTDSYAADIADVLSGCEIADADLDGVPTGSDNCPSVANPDQANHDADPDGDACDLNDDDDAIVDSSDQCPILAGPTLSGCPVAGRSLTLAYSARKHKFKGALSSATGQCKPGAGVTVYKLHRGPDPKVGTATSNSKGKYKLSKQVGAGRYYASVSKAVVPNVAECAAAKSPKLKVK